MKFNVLAISVIFVLGLAFAFHIPGPGTDNNVSAAWASWMQAFGSVAAILALVWTVRIDERRRDKEALLIAELAAAAMLTRLRSIDGFAHGCMESLAQNPLTQGQFAVRLDDLTELGVAQAADIERLLPIPGAVAIDLVLIFTALENIRILCERGARPVTDPGTMRQRADVVISELRVCVERIERTQKGMADFLKKRGHTVVDSSADVKTEAGQAAP